jgi:hypothetical protein
MFGDDGMHRVVAAINYAAKNGCPVPLTLLAPQAGDKMLKMNAAALLHRYGDDPKVNYPGGYKFVNPGKLSEIQMCKTLHCFRYQCTEGDVSKTELYKQVEAITEWFDERVGYGGDGVWSNETNERAYNEAKWG